MFQGKTHHTSSLLIVIVLGLHFSAEDQASNNLPQWTWNCFDDKCVPLKPRLDTAEKLQSLVTCTMLCGPIKLWPQPTGSVSLATTGIHVRASSFHLTFASISSRQVANYFKKAFELFKKELQNRGNSKLNHDFYEVTVEVSISGSEDIRMLVDTDESYVLSIQVFHEVSVPKHLIVKITAQSFCGARHALETLSQLIWFDPYESSLFILKGARINDSPRFSYRGLMLDTARSYFPVSEIIRVIDGMGACKLNTFHWHATDSESFSLSLNSVPELAKHGAYSPSAVYTTEDVRTVVRHARLRGVRVLLEVDTPAHVGRAWSWSERGVEDPLTHCVDAPPWSKYCGDPPCGQLNPRNLRVYDILERIYSEVIQLTGVDDVYHLGGNDVSESCWAHAFNKTNVMDMWVSHTSNSIKILEKITGTIPNLTIIWSSKLKDYITTELVSAISHIGLQIDGVSWLNKIDGSFRYVVSHQDAWDLNTGLGAWYEEGGGTPYNNWQRIYEHRAWSAGKVRPEGGEATVWSSTLAPGALGPHVWPRAAALAERLWADYPEGVTRGIRARLDVHRMRLLERGIPCAPVWSMWCTHNPYTCD